MGSDPQKPVQNRSPEDVRAFLRDREQGAVMLLDVRQPDEFEEGRIPGARLIPLGELPDRLRELERDKPTVVYCRRGGRGSAGASVLMHAGFSEVYNLDGGISAWNGHKVAGPPDAGAFWFAEASSLDDYVAQAWAFEEGARIFYERAGAVCGDDEAEALFRELGEAEEHHKSALLDLHHRLAGPQAVFPRPGDPPRPDVMEGGAALSEALAWVEGRPVDEVLEYAMALEGTAYDRYVQLCREQEEGPVRTVLRLLADAEKKHFDQLTHLFEKRR